MIPGIQKPLDQQTDFDRQMFAGSDRPGMSALSGFGAAFSRGTNLTQAAYSGLQYLNRGNGDQITPEEAKESYGIEINEPVSSNYAEYLYSKQQKAAENDFILGQINPDSFGSTAFPLLGGLAKGLVDPVGIISGTILTRAAVGGAVMALGRSSAMSQSIINTAKMNTIGESVKMGFAQGALESVYSLPAIYWEEKEILGQELTKEQVVMDVFTNLAGNALFNSVGFGVGRMIKRNGDKATAEMYQNGLNQAMNDKVPDMRHHQKALDAETFRVKPTDPEPNFTPLTPGTLAQTKFYAVAKGAEVTPQTVRNFDTPLGDSIMITDNQTYATNNATSTLVKDPANVVEVNVSELNTLDLDQPLPREVESIVRDILTERGTESSLLARTLGDPESPSSGITLFERLNRLEDVVDGFRVEQVNQRLSEMGYDGYKHTGGSRVDGELDTKTAHNVISVFNKDKMTVGQSFEPKVNPGEKVDVTPEFEAQKAYLDSADSEFMADVEFNAEMSTVPDAPIDMAQIEARIQQIIRDTEIVETIESSPLREQFKGDVEQIRNLAMAKERSGELYNAAEFCLRQGGSV